MQLRSKGFSGPFKLRGAEKRSGKEVVGRGFGQVNSIGTLRMNLCPGGESKKGPNFEVGILTPFMPPGKSACRKKPLGLFLCKSDDLAKIWCFNTSLLGTWEHFFDSNPLGSTKVVPEEGTSGFDWHQPYECLSHHQKPNFTP